MRRLFAVLVIASLAATAPAGAARADRRGPRVSYTTAEDAILVGSPVADPSGSLPTVVTGRVTDNRSGVHAVEATWVWCTSSTDESCTVLATEPPMADGGPVSLACNRSRRSCTWSISAPVAPGSYWLGVSATDHAGNDSPSAGILHLTVV